MNFISYIVSAIICHFIVETFIQSQTTRETKSSTDQKHISRLRNYSVVYGVFVSTCALVVNSGFTGICASPLMFASAALSGMVFYSLMYIASIRLANLLIVYSKGKFERIYFEWFFNIISILLFLIVLNYITQI